MGDPAGIGPEIAIKALQDKEIYGKCIPVIVGDRLPLEDANLFTGSRFQMNKITNVKEASGSYGTIDYLDLSMIQNRVKYGQVSAEYGNAAFHYVTTAMGLALKDEIQAVATGPINKEALFRAGHHFSGHTEIFSHYTMTKDYAMLLISDNLRVIHVTTHVSMRKACDLIQKDRVVRTIQLADEAMKMMGLTDYKIGVAGLNAHCSENGLFGDEEALQIIPAVQKAQSMGIPVEGPVPPDTVFVKALAGVYGIVVAMYHDQGHIPLKLCGFKMDKETGEFTSVSGINTTVGLPIIRTSVDHGTAFDRAGKNLANAQSMKDAIDLAVKMAAAKQAKGGAHG